MKIQESKPKKEIENLLPLVNVVFLLLIFFMVAGAFSSPELYKVDLPYSDSQMTQESEELKIILDEYGNLALNDKSVSIDSISESIMTFSKDSNSITEIQLKADAKVDAVIVVDLIERLNATNLEAIHIITSSAY
ncbi:MAG: biopolymer transporter ExbD [Pseudomonadota bacterium]